jgi:hypothetical protein
MTVPRGLCTGIRKNVLIITTTLSVPPSPPFFSSCCFSYSLVVTTMVLTRNSRHWQWQQQSLLVNVYSFHAKHYTMAMPPAYPPAMPRQNEFYSLCLSNWLSLTLLFFKPVRIMRVNLSGDNEFQMRDAPAVPPCHSAPWLPNRMILLIKLIISSIESSSCVCSHWV